MDHNYNELLFSNEIFLMMSRYFGGFITVLFLYVLSSVFIAANLNTKKLYDSFQLNYKQTFLYITLLFIGVFSISKQVEFLYFVF